MNTDVENKPTIDLTKGAKPTADPTEDDRPTEDRIYSNTHTTSEFENMISQQ